jgi:hypothetical protein
MKKQSKKGKNEILKARKKIEQAERGCESRMENKPEAAPAAALATE